MFKNFVLALALVVGLAVVAPRASATIIYSICSGGCGSSSGSYAATDSAPQAAGLTFPSPISFSAGNLNNGVYTDPTTGIIITAWNGSSVDTGATINGSAFKLSTGGAGTGYMIALPANTFAFSFNFGATGFANDALAINGTNLGSSNYLVQESSGFVSIISNTALSSLFFGANSSGGTVSLGDFQPGNGGGGGGGATPEPSSYLLLGSGLIGMVWVRRRRRPQTIRQRTRP